MPQGWYKLDNVAKMFVATQTRRDPRVFRLGCTLYEEIDPQALAEALARDVCAKAATLTPSARGELEITDLNNLYLKEGRMSVVPMGRGIVWLDAGTPDSLADATHFMQVIEKRQGLKIACVEEIAFAKGFIDESQMQNLIDDMKKGAYREYLIKVLEEKHELY